MSETDRFKNFIQHLKTISELQSNISSMSPTIAISLGYACSAGLKIEIRFRPSRKTGSEPYHTLILL